MSIHPKPINPIRRCFSSPPACTHTRTNDTARHARWLPPGLHPAVAATAIQLLIIIWRPFLSKRNPYRTSSRYLTEGHLFGLWLRAARATRRSHVTRHEYYTTSSCHADIIKQLLLRVLYVFVFRMAYYCYTRTGRWQLWKWSGVGKKTENMNSK